MKCRQHSLRTRVQPSAEGVHAVQELLRILSATREAQEIERKRRLAWEQEQEAKFIQHQAKLDRTMLDLRHELNILRSTATTATTASPSTGLLTPQSIMSPPLAVQQPPQPASPISPISQPSSYTHPSFVQGSSNQPFTSYHSYANDFSAHHTDSFVADSSAPSVTPAPSPPLTFVQPSQLHNHQPMSPVNGRKRQTSDLSSDDQESSNSDSDTLNNRRPSKRVSHHDKRCLTIHVSARTNFFMVALMSCLACDA